MTKLNAGLFGALSGKIGNVVVVNRGKTTYVRSVPKYTEESWTDSQRQVRKRFALVSKFCQEYKKSIIFPIWNLLPGPSSGYNKFLGTNIKAFDKEGNIMDMSLLHFSNGVLTPPLNLSVEKRQGEVAISWSNDTALSRTRTKDKLMFMAVKDGDGTTNGEITGPVITGSITNGSKAISPTFAGQIIIGPEITSPEITDPVITSPEINSPEINSPENTSQIITDPEITDPVITSPENASPIITGPHQTAVTRGQMEAVIANADESIVGLYLFFAASDRKAFSPDRYLVV